jgi:hypothetical protein
VSQFLLNTAIHTHQAKLQSRTKYDYKAVLSEIHGQEPFQSPNGKPLASYQDVVRRFNDVDDYLNHTEEWSRREAQITTAIASFGTLSSRRHICIYIYMRVHGF